MNPNESLDCQDMALAHMEQTIRTLRAELAEAREALDYTYKLLSKSCNHQFNDDCVCTLIMRRIDALKKGKNEVSNLQFK